MSDQSPRLGLPFVRAGQLQKHVTVNESLIRLDSLVQTAVQSRGRNSPPQVVVEGEMFILGNAPSGDWANYQAGQMVVADFNGWRVLEPHDGQIAFILEEEAAVIWSLDQWQPLGECLGGVLSVQQLGIGATPDANNPFSARLNKALWTAKPTTDDGDGDLRFTFNKQADSNTASLLFQSNWQGRAEIGLTGDDDLRLKVSADGNVWREAFSVDRATGVVSFAKGASRFEVLTLTTSQDLTLPDWVRRVDVQCVGGGGGGGSGSFGTPGVVRTGGGGGGAGGVMDASLMRSALGDTLVVTVGSGGDGGSAGNGQTGGTSSVRLGSREIIRALGGQGGLMTGVAGTGGAGRVSANQGGLSGADALARAGASVTFAAGSGGGGAGGGISAAGVANVGAAGGAGGMTLVRVNGGTAGSTAGGAGQDTILPDLSTCGGGGGGGAARADGAGYTGGNGANYGAGGGGGGAGTTAGGQGGAGGAGIVILTLVG